MRIWTINANQIKLFTMKMIKENLHIRRLNKRIEIWKNELLRYYKCLNRMGDKVQKWKNYKTKITKFLPALKKLIIKF